MRKINTSLPVSINYESVSQLINIIDSDKQDSVVTWNSGGGSTGAGQVLMAYLNDSTININSDTAGLAASMGAFLIPFFKKSKGANQSDIMIHSVAGGESSTHKHTNELLYNAWANKIDLVKFKEITGKELKEVMFPEGGRVDVWLTGKQAGEIGLFDETYDLLDKAANIESKLDIKQIDYDLPEEIKNKYFKTAKIVKSNINEMEIKDVKVADLQSGNPSVVEAIAKEAREKEQKRVAGIMKYAEYDMEKAAKMIEDGSVMGVEEVEHFMEKKFNTKKVAELEEGSEGKIDPAKKEAKVVEEKTAEQEEKDAALIALRETLGTADLVETDKK